MTHATLRLNLSEPCVWSGTLDWGGYAYPLRAVVQCDAQGPLLAFEVGPASGCHPAMLLPGEDGYDPAIAEAAPMRAKPKPHRFPRAPKRPAEPKPKTNRSVMR